MSHPSARQWSTDEKALLATILEQLIPASDDGRVPSGASLGVANFIAAAMASDPELDALAGRALKCVKALDETDDLALVTQLERREPAAFAALLRQAYMGYYSDARVRPLFGLSDQPTQPAGYAVPPDNPIELAALTAPVTLRGDCFRKC